MGEVGGGGLGVGEGGGRGWKGGGGDDLVSRNRQFSFQLSYLNVFKYTARIRVETLLEKPACSLVPRPYLLNLLE